MSTPEINTKRETMERKKRLAFVLYTQNDFNNKVICNIISVSEKTLIAWKNDDAKTGSNWDTERQAVKMGPEKVMRRIMKIYERQLDIIEYRKHPENVPTSKEGDVLSKLADAAKKLQADLTFFVKSEVGKQFINYIQSTHGQAKAIEAVELWHEYLMATA